MGGDCKSPGSAFEGSNPSPATSKTLSKGRSNLMKTKVRKTTAKRANADRLHSVTPGELLWEEFMVPMGLTRYHLYLKVLRRPLELGY